MKHKIVIFYGREVGHEIYKTLKNEKSIEIIHAIKVGKKKDLTQNFNKKKIKESWDCIYKKLKKFNNFTIITAWWGFIIPSKILKLSKKNTINLHPSFLPYGRGKYSNVWAIINKEPFGATICSLASGIDSGRVYIQKKLNYDLFDTAEDLYIRSVKELISLFKRNYKKILAGSISSKKSIINGSYYSSSRIKNIRKLQINKRYRLSELIKRINAVTYSGYPKAYFIKNKKKYSLEIKILKQN